MYFTIILFTKHKQMVKLGSMLSVNMKYVKFYHNLGIWDFALQTTFCTSIR